VAAVSAGRVWGSGPTRTAAQAAVATTESPRTEEFIFVLIPGNEAALT
jgi:hypothetical protein